MSIPAVDYSNTKLLTLEPNQSAFKDFAFSQAINVLDPDFVRQALENFGAAYITSRFEFWNGRIVSLSDVQRQAPLMSVSLLHVLNPAVSRELMQRISEL